MFSIRTRLLILLIPITLAMLATLAYINYRQTTEIYTASVEDSLQTTLRAKRAALVEYFETAEMIGASIAATDIVQTYIGLTNRNLGGGNLETLKRLQQRVGNVLQSFQENHWGRYHHIFLLNRSNRIVISPGHGISANKSSSSLLGRDLSSNRWAMGSLHKGRTMVSDYWSWKSSGQVHQVLFFPVRDASNRIQATIGIELYIPKQQQIVSEGFSMGATGRIYLASEKGVPIPQKGVTNRAPLTGDALNQVKQSGDWLGRRMNAQHQEVIGYFLKQDKYPWILAAEVETGEVFGDLLYLQKILLAGLVGILVVLAVLAVIYANSLARPLLQLSSQVERISRGEFSIDIPDTRRKDEIGKLTVSLQQLVFSLQMVSKKLRQAKALKKAS